MKKLIAAAVCTALLLSSCAAANEATLEFFAMDTYIKLTAYGGPEQAFSEVRDEVNALDELLSVTDPDSEVYSHNMHGRELQNSDALLIYSQAVGYGEITDGAFDVHIYPVVEAWGFFSGEYRIPDEDELERLLKNREMLDFGGIAKGFAADRAVEIMRRHGIKSALIALGGNIYAVGNKPDGEPWQIAVQNPFDMSDYSGVLSLTDEAAVTSGAYARYFERDGVTYHHIIDPRTGYPAESGLSSVTVVSANSTLADALSTGLFVLGKERALEIWSDNPGIFELVLIETGGEITITGGLRGRFESSHDFKIAA